MTDLDMIFAWFLIGCGVVGFVAAVVWFFGEFDGIFHDKGDWK